MSIAKNIQYFQKELPQKVKLVAVSKTKPNEMILEAYKEGQKIFGENKVQDIVNKAEKLPKDIKWHFIGHLQTNKVKFIAPFVSLIHAVDSLKLLKTINQEGERNNRVIDCLLQIFIAKEETKFGLSEKEAMDMIDSNDFARMKNVCIRGLMGMATYTDDENQIRDEFASLGSFFSTMKNSHFSNIDSFNELSMGMSSDYQIAIGQGSTMIRIGSTIFGER